MNVPETTIAYLAGIITSRGGFGYDGGRAWLYFMTLEPEIADEALGLWDGHVVKSYAVNGDIKHKFAATRGSAPAAIEDIRPHLRGSKRERADAVLGAMSSELSTFCNRHTTRSAPALTGRGGAEGSKAVKISDDRQAILDGEVEAQWERAHAQYWRHRRATEGYAERLKALAPSYSAAIRRAQADPVYYCGSHVREALKAYRRGGTLTRVTPSPMKQGEHDEHGRRTKALAGRYRRQRAATRGIGGAGTTRRTC
jgi:hypothetical protein